ncbi:unnamed protein product [Lathyrus sativus]|nr:unnamed protein product [Lathyrus sativus]
MSISHSVTPQITFVPRRFSVLGFSHIIHRRKSSLFSDHRSPFIWNMKKVARIESEMVASLVLEMVASLVMEVLICKE